MYTQRVQKYLITKPTYLLNFLTYYAYLLYLLNLLSLHTKLEFFCFFNL